MTHIITADTAPGYIDRAQWNGLTTTSKKRSAARKMARLMLDAGLADGPVEGRSPDGALLWTHRSLAEFARFDISEEPRLAYTRWVANPMFAKVAA